ncbi:ankyrin repeat domain-containing protein 40 [Cricetulus griseus]|uniref:Ankyrin repeat domain-containing protein 40 n=1 Tax=Cricetulus griseus TaxID=10029 RepID=A0A061HWN9_CRIGR|nr:ankyrin repeat domain-containing protein 40 [Cricetulus griseus]
MVRHLVDVRGMAVLYGSALPLEFSGECQQGMNSHLPTDPCDGKPDNTGPELVLKVRIHNSKENDFIEIELHRQELSYQSLLQVSCCELGIHPEQVEKMRKLPNTLLRKDKDIQRLQDFEEIEVLVKSRNSEWTQHTASPLTERPCYNSEAAKMTY